MTQNSLKNPHGQHNPTSFSLGHTRHIHKILSQPIHSLRVIQLTAIDWHKTQPSSSFRFGGRKIHWPGRNSSDIRRQ